MYDKPDSLKINTKKDQRLREDLMQVCSEKDWSLAHVIRKAARIFISKYNTEITTIDFKQNANHKIR